MDGWNFDVENVPEGDARKIVTLEQDGMTWVGIRAFHHQDKVWFNGNEREIARIVAWQDLPPPANPNCFAPLDTAESERAMRDEVIRQIEQEVHERAQRAVDARDRVVFK